MRKQARVPKSIDPAIDEYIALFDASVQKLLRKVRETIRKAAPDATETISYRMPAFTQNGALVYFAAFKAHIGFYPPVRGDTKLVKAVAKYAGPKGNLQFPYDEPIPYGLIARIVALRVKQNAQRAAAKKARRKK